MFNMTYNECNVCIFSTTYSKSTHAKLNHTWLHYQCLPMGCVFVCIYYFSSVRMRACERVCVITLWGNSQNARVLSSLCMQNAHLFTLLILNWFQCIHNLCWCIYVFVCVCTYVSTINSKFLWYFREYQMWAAFCV